jgi:hypothetical protein
VNRTSWFVVVALLAGTPAFSQSRTLALPRADSASPRADECIDGVVKDDGTAETAYGWVPSVIEGQYVQEFTVDEFPTRELEKVCVCWTRNHPDKNIDFDVVVYADVGGVPALTPAYAIPASAFVVPTWPEIQFYEIDLSALHVWLPTETSYIGVRWNASVDQFFFVCADHSDLPPATNGFYIDDRATEWTSYFDTSDPIFLNHRALMVRANAAAVLQQIPDAGMPARLLFIGILAGVGFAAIRRWARSDTRGKPSGPPTS